MIFIISFVRLTFVASRESYRGVEILLRRALSTWKALVDAVSGLMR